ncbi:hypothetical protein MHC_00770 [Mycoplasma haemocanis str. Illinois]|uniref:Uncharacterized protein n=1 Tax=Mycoplasma haemocanis (strain Illinois) TaxID=1111676 RepID=H6N5R0_MYCHN|nr:hypothetical protein [Mycoplasma haemocanis]AEW45020.1 hypothetical protein MHC_00770 [Mycoplasma haemocanis str. Illinois]
MTGAVKSILTLGGIGGAGSLAVGGVYFNSRETIGNLVKDKVLGISPEFNDSWKDQHKKLLSYTGELSPELKHIKEKYINSELSESIEALKNWCKTSYKKTYKTSLSKAQESLLQEVTTYCIQSTKEKLQSSLTTGSGNKVLSGTGDKDEFVKNYKTLKDHDANNNGVLDSTLASWKDGAETKADSDWSNLQKWCENHYDYPFKGVTDLFKNLRKYCTKTS